jgi:hypothetical protein
MAGASDTWFLQFTALQPNLLHINLRQITMFVQGTVIPYFGDVPVTFVQPNGPLYSQNKTSRTLASYYTKFVYKIPEGRGLDSRWCHWIFLWT